MLPITHEITSLLQPQSLGQMITLYHRKNDRDPRKTHYILTYQTVVFSILKIHYYLFTGDTELYCMGMVDQSYIPSY